MSGNSTCGNGFRATWTTRSAKERDLLPRHAGPENVAERRATCVWPSGPPNAGERASPPLKSADPAVDSAARWISRRCRSAAVHQKHAALDFGGSQETGRRFPCDQAPAHVKDAVGGFHAVGRGLLAAPQLGDQRMVRKLVELLGQRRCPTENLCRASGRSGMEEWQATEALVCGRGGHHEIKRTLLGAGMALLSCQDRSASKDTNVIKQRVKEIREQQQPAPARSRGEGSL